MSTRHTVTIPAPTVAYPGPDDTDAGFMRIAAKHLEGGFAVGGSNLTRAVIDLLRSVADAMDAPVSEAETLAVEIENHGASPESDDDFSRGFRSGTRRAARIVRASA